MLTRATLAPMAHKTQARRITTGQGTPNEMTVVRTTLDIPVATYDAYAERALKHARDPEDLMSIRLTATATHGDGALYFTPEQKKRLDSACGHVISDAEGALQRLGTLVKIKCNDVVIEIEPRLLQRLNTRVWRGHTLEGDIQKVVLHALRVHAGLEPA